MKLKTAIFLLAILTLSSFSSAYAQLGTTETVESCTVNGVNKTNYVDCCLVDPTLLNAVAPYCTAYRQSPNFCTEQPDEPGCKIPALRGGTQNTTAQNTTTTTTIFNTPTSGSAELTSCNSIQFKSILDILVWLKCIIVAAVIPLIFALAFFFFLWGVFKFISASDPKAKQESQKIIWWGVIGLFVMVSVWGIIKIIGNTLGIDSKTVPALQTEYLKPSN